LHDKGFVDTLTLGTTADEAGQFHTGKAGQLGGRDQKFRADGFEDLVPLGRRPCLLLGPAYRAAGVLLFV
jgi:hypothetical protein